MPKQHTITLIPGDGIGPEVTNAVVRILEGAAAATGASFQWESYAVGATLGQIEATKEEAARLGLERCDRSLLERREELTRALFERVPGLAA